jgi:hypothetical protein
MDSLCHVLPVDYKDGRGSVTGIPDALYRGACSIVIGYDYDKQNYLNAL